MNGAHLNGVISSGVIIIDKPSGWTSHDCVASVKKRLKARKVGHLGTLDPLATGMLVLVVNGATRFARFLDGGKKDYLVSMRLGSTTDTYDSEGAVLATGDTSSISDGAVISAFSGFSGRIKQVPPMYSAIKKDGVPLYRLARKGEVIEREARDVEIFSLEILRVSVPDVEFRVVCSKGTYVRSICNDAGAILGCGGHLTGLRRMGSGPFRMDGAPGPDADPEVLKAAIIPLGEALSMAGAPAEALGMAAAIG